LNHMVFQVQFARRRDAVPLTRDYIAQWERRQLASMPGVRDAANARLKATG
jgi:hypothetical protein